MAAKRSAKSKKTTKKPIKKKSLGRFVLFLKILARSGSTQTAAMVSGLDFVGILERESAETCSRSEIKFLRDVQRTEGRARLAIEALARKHAKESWKACNVILQQQRTTGRQGQQMPVPTRIVWAKKGQTPRGIFFDPNFKDPDPINKPQAPEPVHEPPEPDLAAAADLTEEFRQAIVRERESETETDAIERLQAEQQEAEQVAARAEENPQTLAPARELPESGR